MKQDHNHLALSEHKKPILCSCEFVTIKLQWNLNSTRVRHIEEKLRQSRHHHESAEDHSGGEITTAAAADGEAQIESATGGLS